MCYLHARKPFSEVRMDGLSMSFRVPCFAINYLAVTFLLALVGCGSSIRTSIIPTHYSQYTYPPRSSWDPRVFTEKPRTQYTVVGAIELRSSRPATVAKLFKQLIAAADELEADAIIPPSGKGSSRADGSLPQGSNPYRAYYVLDDSQQQVLEATAIRLPRYVVIAGQRRYAGSTEELASIATTVKSGDGCVPVWVDMPSGPAVIGTFLSEQASYAQRVHGCDWRNQPLPPTVAAPPKQ
jgi:hypothetical protein